MKSNLRPFLQECSFTKCSLIPSIERHFFFLSLVKKKCISSAVIKSTTQTGRLIEVHPWPDAEHYRSRFAPKIPRNPRVWYEQWALVLAQQWNTRVIDTTFLRCSFTSHEPLSTASIFFHTCASFLLQLASYVAVGVCVHPPAKTNPQTPAPTTSLLNYPSRTATPQSKIRGAPPITIPCVLIKISPLRFRWGNEKKNYTHIENYETRYWMRLWGR